MNPEILAFYLFSSFALAGGVFILLTRNVLYAAFGLLSAFLGVAALYVLARADFLAVAQIMIYVGGILVLVMFSIMISRTITGEEMSTGTGKGRVPFGGLLVALGLFSMLQLFLYIVPFESLPWIRRSAETNTVVKESVIQETGIHLMTGYLFPFELAAVILLIALLGAAYMAAHLVKKGR